MTTDNVAASQDETLDTPLEATAEAPQTPEGMRAQIQKLEGDLREIGRAHV